MNAAPVLVGFVAILALAFTLVLREPSPGGLAASHAEIGTTLESCAVCHTSDGLDAGCLACHDEIEKQVRTGQGFHAGRASDCARCHPDHHGAGFDMMESVAWGDEGRSAFRHDHVAFALTDRHDELACKQCHRKDRTYQGLQQDCGSCHEDVHGGNLFRDCAKCHDQARFKPASRFDHDAAFPLLGRHAEAACDRCHGGLEYRDVKGRECLSCHETPHRFAAPKGCEECHGAADFSWSAAQSRFDAKRHAADAGFVLSKPHVALECTICHKPDLPYEARFPQPARKAEDCRACHDDVHRGQFGDVTCTTCHDEMHFAPAAYGVERHTTFALRESHVKTECRACHKEVDGTRQFVGTPRTCAECHHDPHAGQFKAACTACHDETRFKPARYGVEQHTTFALRGSHVRTECGACHKPIDGTRRFAGTPRTCAECHQDPHAGQFKAACTTCHDETRFKPSHYAPEDHRTFALTGAHGAVACNSCHIAVNGVRRFRDTPRQCATCHENPHGHQFANEIGAKGCVACHETTSFRIPDFDHDTRTTYPLKDAHAEADCSRCHRAAGNPPVRRYAGTDRACASCHRDEHRGQFADGRCDRCHSGFREWEIRKFDHARTRFPLDGRHRRVSCDDCHPKVRQRDGREVVQYRPLGHQCKDCHEVERR